MNKVTISIIQANLVWENAAANRIMFQEKIAALNPDNHVVVLPEMFTTGFSMNPSALAETMSGLTVLWMKEMAAKYNAVICGSVIIEEAGNYYNRFLWIEPNGSIQYYDKRHLFAYAGEHNHYTAGNQKFFVEKEGINFLCNVCYDLRFPVWARQETKQYDVLMYVANWPEKRRNAWKALLVARAIENQCYVIGVNRVGTDGNGHVYTGDSMVVDPLGEVVFHNENDEITFSIEIDKSHIDAVRTQLPFLKDADVFHIVHK